VSIGLYFEGDLATRVEVVMEKVRTAFIEVDTDLPDQFSGIRSIPGLFLIPQTWPT